MTTAAYPLTTQEPYPHDQWWVAAYADELGRHLLARDILGEPVILYRTQAGAAVAVAGICPHRAFPLARGRLVGDTLQCGYHGFEYGADASGKRLRCCLPTSGAFSSSTACACEGRTGQRTSSSLPPPLKTSASWQS